MQRIQYLTKDFKGSLVADLLQISARLCNLFNPELFRPASRPPRTDPGTAARASAPRNDTMRIQTETLPIGTGAAQRTLSPPHTRPSPIPARFSPSVGPARV